MRAFRVGRGAARQARHGPFGHVGQGVAMRTSHRVSGLRTSCARLTAFPEPALPTTEDCGTWRGGGLRDTAGRVTLALRRLSAASPEGIAFSCV